MKRRGLAGWVTVWALIAGCGDQPTKRPPSLDLPAGLEASSERPVRQDIERRHAALDSALGADSASPATLAERYGDFGISLYAHDYLAESLEALAWASRLAPRDPRWPYYSGLARRRTGDMEASGAAFQRVLEVEPDNLAARLWLAEVMLSREQLATAEDAYSWAAEREPHCPQAWIGLGRVALSRGDYELAIEHLQTALDHQPDSPPARYAHAMALRGLGRLDEARAELARLGGENHSVIVSCAEDPLVAEVRRRQTGTRAHEERAIRAREEGRLTAALVELRAAARMNPHRYPARFDAAQILLRLGRHDEAREELESLLALAPDYAAALSLLARLEARAGEWPRVEELLAAAAQADPEAEAVALDRAEIYRAADRCPEALTAYERALELAPDSAAAAIGHAGCLAALGRPREAIDALRSRRAAFPSRHGLASAEAYLLVVSGATREPLAAVEIARTAVERQPTAIGEQVLASALAAAGRPTEAIEWQRRALADMPSEAAWLSLREDAAAGLANLEAGRWVRPGLDMDTIAALMYPAPAGNATQPEGNTR